MSITQIIGFILAMVAKLSNSGAKFASLTYTNKEGETSRYTLLLGTKYENVLKSSLATVRARKANTPLEEEAKEAVMASISKSLQGMLTGEGNSDYTCQDVYENIAPGIKVHKETGEMYISGIQVSRKVLVPGVYKPVNSKPLTLAKQAMERGTAKAKYRQFKLSPEQLDSVRIGGKELVLAS